MKAHRPAVLLVVFALMFLFRSGLADEPRAPEDRARYYEPVEVPGKLLADLIGRPLSHLAVFAYHNGQWTVILSQIDEVAPNGDWVLPQGPEQNARLGNGKLDQQDLLVFMARDAGDQAPADAVPPGAQKAVPVEVMDPLTKTSWWVYAASFEGDAPVSQREPYARLVDEKNYNVRFSSYGYDGLTNTRENEVRPTIFINKLWVNPEAGGNGKNIIDRQKIRGGIRFLSGMVEVPINEKIVSGGLVAYKAGPIRIISHSVMYPLFPMGIKGPRFSIDSIMADTLTLTTTIVNVPFDPGSVITDMTLVFMTDLSPVAEGMYYYNSNNLGGFLIDGHMDEQEKAMKPGKDEWRLVTGPQGTQVQYTVFDSKFMTDAEATSTYNDNVEDAHPPENFPGDIGAAADRIVIRSLPEGSYQIKTFGCVPFNFYDPQGLNQKQLKDILNISRAPLKVKASGREVENQGGRQRQLIRIPD